MRSRLQTAIDVGEEWDPYYLARNLHPEGLPGANESSPGRLPEDQRASQREVKRDGRRAQQSQPEPGQKETDTRWRTADPPARSASRAGEEATDRAQTEHRGFGASQPKRRGRPPKAQGTAQKRGGSGGRGGDQAREGEGENRGSSTDWSRPARGAAQSY